MPTPTMNHVDVETEPGGSRLLTIGITIMIVVALGLGAFFVLGRSSDPQPVTPPPAPAPVVDQKQAEPAKPLENRTENKTENKTDEKKADAPKAASVAGVCTGVKHLGPGNSKFLVALATNLTGPVTVEVSAPKTKDGKDRTITVEVPLTNGVGEGNAAIDSFGTYTITSVKAADGTKIEPSKLPSYKPLTVDKNEVACTSSSLTPPPAG